MQLRCRCLSGRWASAAGDGYSPPRWPLPPPPPPEKLPTPLLPLPLDAVETDLRPGLAGGQLASMISSSGSKPGLSRLQACREGGDGAPRMIPPPPAAPRPRSWCCWDALHLDPRAGVQSVRRGPRGVPAGLGRLRPSPGPTPWWDVGRVLIRGHRPTTLQKRAWLLDPDLVYTHGARVEEDKEGRFVGFGRRPPPQKKDMSSGRKHGCLGGRGVGLTWWPAHEKTR